MERRRPARQQRVQAEVAEHALIGYAPKRPHRARPKMPRSTAEAADVFEPAVWLGDRIARFRPITTHPAFRQILGRLLGGQSGDRVADWLQATLDADDPLGASSIGRNALARRLYRFKSLLPPGQALSAGYLDRKFLRLDAEIDELAHMDALIRYQITRLEIMAEKEVDFQVPVEAQRQEVAQLADLLMKRREMVKGVGNVMLNFGPQTNVAQAIVIPEMSRQAGTVDEWLLEHPEKIPALAQLFDALEEVGADDAKPAG
jgi:hypothetical protein